MGAWKFPENIGIWSFLDPCQRISVGKTSYQYAHWFLREMSEEVNQVVTNICEESVKMDAKVGRCVDESFTSPGT